VLCTAPCIQHVPPFALSALPLALQYSVYCQVLPTGTCHVLHLVPTCTASCSGETVILCVLPGVANRDIKLDNILLDSSVHGKPDWPILKICDWGYAKHDAKSIAKSRVVRAPLQLRCKRPRVTAVRSVCACSWLERHGCIWLRPAAGRVTA
jgi:serine/threonine protein kinase